jgi:hypothetical protein
MSLTTFMGRSDVRAKMARDFPKPALLVQGSTRALPCGRHAALVGTAGDYLLRFYCEHRNPHAHTRRLVAEAGRRRMESFAPSARVVALADEALAAAAHHREHVRATGEITRAAATNALALAQIDSVARTLRYNESWFTEPDGADVDDVMGVAALFPARPRERHLQQPRARRAALLQPCGRQLRLARRSPRAHER